MEQSTKTKIYVSTLTETTSRGIYEATFNADNGHVSGDARLVGEGRQTSFILQHPTERGVVFAVQETDDLRTPDGKATGGVYVFATESDGSTLRKVQEVLSYGTAPCYLAFDATRSVLLCANYMSGTVSAFKYSNGTLQHAATAQNAYYASDHPRQESAHAHSVQVFKDKYYLCADLGSDTLFLYDADGGKLDLVSESRVPAKQGPRHFVIDGDYVYLVGELAGTLLTLKWNGNTFDVLNTQPLLDNSEEYKLFNADATDNLASHIAMSADRHFLYVANRGPDSVSVFARDANADAEARAVWRKVQVVSCGGSFPRYFTFVGKDEGYILVANQRGNNVRSLKRDVNTGTLQLLADTHLDLATPMFIIDLQVGV